MKKNISKLLQRYGLVIILALTLIGMLIFFKKFMIFLIFLAAATLVSFIPVIVGTHLIGIEVSSLPALVFFFAYGWTEATIYFVISLIIYTFIAHSLSIPRLVVIFLCPFLLLILSPFKESLGIVYFGMLWMILNHCVLISLTIFFGIARLHKRIIFTCTHLFWCWVFYNSFAEALVKLIA